MSETMDNPLTESTVSSSFNPQASTTNSSLNKMPCEDFTLEDPGFYQLRQLGDVENAPRDPWKTVTGDIL